MTPTFRLLSLANTIRTERDNMLADRYDMTGVQYDALQVLHAHGPTGMSDIARMLHHAFPTMTDLADRLERKRWAERQRSGRDRRAILLAIASERKADFAAIAADVAALQAQWDEMLAGALPAMEEALARVG